MVAIKSLGLEDTKHHLSKGYMLYELQLGDDIRKLGVELYLEQMMSLREIYSEFKVLAVHTPLMPYADDVRLDNLHVRQQDFYDTCEVANAFAIAQGSLVGVIVHSGLNEDDLINAGGPVVKIIAKALELYEHIDIRIENIVELWFKNDNLMAYKGCSHEYHNVARQLRQIINSSRIHSILDICHAQICIYMRDVLKTKIKGVPGLCLEDYFKCGQGICNQLHIAQGVKTNDGTTHGTGFSQSKLDDVELLGYIIGLTKKYLPGALNVIEVTEDDYHSCPKQFETYKLFETLLGEYDQK